MNGGIYTIRIDASEKFYVGRTKNFKTRRAQHFWMLRKNIHHCKHLQNKFNKNEPISFIEEEIENDKNARIELEQKWLNKYGSLNVLLNHCMIAHHGDFGGKSWNEKRKRIPHNKGTPSPFKGIPRDQSVKNKISETKKLKGQTEAQMLAFIENCKKIDRKKARKPMSNETKEKLRKANLGIKKGSYPKSHGEKISIARKGMKFSDEHRKKLSIAAKNRKGTGR